MRFLPPSVLGVLLALAVCAAYLADRILGIAAFTFGYLLFCLVAAAVFGCAWRALVRRAWLPAAVTAFCAFGAILALPPPSERLLRAAMLRAPAGTDASEIARIVRDQYKGSAYAMPRISEDRTGGFDRVRVSLLSQKARSCTAAIFLVENGRVTRSIFSPD